MRYVAFVRQRRRHPLWQALPQGRAPDRPASQLFHLAGRHLRRREAYDNETSLVHGVPEDKTDEDLSAVVTFTKAVETPLEEHAS
jgi:hypothetical protein